MLLPTVFLFRDPPRPENTQDIRQVLASAAVVLSDARFILLIFVYSCFWILYFQNFGTVLWYLRDFIDPGPVNELFARAGIALKFDAEHVTVINAGTIVLLQIVVSRVVKNIGALPTMMGGILIGSAGFLLLASSQSVWIFMAGIAVFSIGEMTCHPKYYSYIGLIAPQDKKAVYMGYAFLYGVIGALVGSTVGGEMYNAILTPLQGREDAGAVLRNLLAGLRGPGRGHDGGSLRLPPDLRGGYPGDTGPGPRSRDGRLRPLRPRGRGHPLPRLCQAGPDPRQDRNPGRNPDRRGSGRASDPPAHPASGESLRRGAPRGFPEPRGLLPGAVRP